MVIDDGPVAFADEAAGVPSVSSSRDFAGAARACDAPCNSPADSLACDSWPYDARPDWASVASRCRA